MELTPEFMIGICSIGVPALVSLAVTGLTLYFEHRNAKKEMKHSRMLETYELGLRLLTPAPEGFLAMAEKQYACDLVRLSSLARAYCDEQLAADINDFVRRYPWSYKTMVCNLLNTEDVWHPTDLFEDDNGNPVQVERSLLEERGEQEYRREVERAQSVFIGSMLKLAKEQSELVEMILVKMAEL